MALRKAKTLRSFGHSECIRVTVNVYTFNTELNYLRKIISLRKSEVSVEKISVCIVIENLAQHGIHFLPCSYTNDI